MKNIMPGVHNSVFLENNCYKIMNKLYFQTQKCIKKLQMLLFIINRNRKLTESLELGLDRLSVTGFYMKCVAQHSTAFGKVISHTSHRNVRG